MWGVSLLRQAYKLVEQAGAEGVTQTDIARGLGQTKLDARTICRNLQRRNTVHSLMKDVGRQRVSRYVSHKFANTGHLTQEFRKERQKMMDMIEDRHVPTSQVGSSCVQIQAGGASGGSDVRNGCGINQDRNDNVKVIYILIYATSVLLHFY